ncbi:MFS transporter [Deltaproteobacteria bacterium Smac51]|nr:MFS transporter [Deltaproteobacteria bacterium Smac51]
MSDAINTPPTEEDPSLSRDRKLILAVAVLCSLLGNMGMTGLNVALPDMERSLGLSAAMMGWMSLSMFMAMAAVAAPGAKLADILGRRRTTFFGLILSIIGLTGSALAPGAASLLAGRVITGFGLAVVFTNGVSMVTTVYPPHQRGRVLGYTIGSVYLGLSLGPVICGYLVSWFGWRSIFWLSTAGFIPPLILIRMVKVEQKPAAGEKFDTRGAILWAAAVLTTFFGLTNITATPYGPILIAIGLGLAIAYVKASLSVDSPVLDVRLFMENRRFAFSSLAAFISYSASMGTGFLLSLYLQYTKGLPTSQAGLILMIQPACQTLITPFAGRLSDRVDAGIMASSGMAILCAAISAAALFLTPQTPLWAFIVLLVMLGCGFAIFGAPNSNAIIGSVPPGRIGQASGTITATRLCGQVFSIALTTLIFSLIIGPGRMSPEKYPDFMRAATICFTIFAPICFTGILASLARGKARS